MGIQITTANTNRISNGQRVLVRTIAGVLYAVIEDTTDAAIEVWKSSDEGLTWAEQDVSNRPQAATYCSPSCAIDGTDIIHIAFQRFNGGNSEANYVAFTTSTDTFGSVEIIDSDIGDNPSDTNTLSTAIAVDTNNKPHIVYTGYTAASSCHTMLYRNKTGAAWSSAITIEGASTSKDCKFPDISCISNSYPYVAYLNDTDDDLTVATGNAINATSFTKGDWDTAVLSGTRITNCYNSSNTGFAAYVDSDNTVGVMQSFTDRNTGNIGTNPSIIEWNSDRYVFYIDTADNDVKYCYWNGTAWSSEVTLETGTFDYVKAKWSYRYNNRGTICLDYLYSDGTNIFWNKLTRVASDPFGTSNCNYIYRYTAATTSFSSNLKGTTSHDLFNDSFAVGDILYFSEGSNYTQLPLISIKFTIATAIAATSYTLVWEQYRLFYTEFGVSQAGWYEITPTLDQTNSFSTTGSNLEVRFYPNEYDYHITINSITSKWLRCRVVAVDTPTEGGAIGATAITAKSNIFTFTKGTVSNPVTFEEFYYNDDAITYGLIQRYSYQYLNPNFIKNYVANIRIYSTDTSNYFKITRTNIFFVHGYIGGTGTFIYGESTTGHPAIGDYGCFISFNHNASIYCGHSSGGDTYAYNTRIETRRGQIILYAMNIHFYGTTVTGTSPLYGGNGITLSYCNINHLNTYTSTATYSTNISNCVMHYVQAYQETNGFITRDANVSNISIQYQTKGIIYDCTYSNFAAYSSIINKNNSYLYQHYSISPTVKTSDGTPIEGVTIHIVDKDGNPAKKWSGDLITGSLIDVEDLITDSNGDASTDILQYSWERDFYPAVVTTTVDYNPFTVVFSKQGYQTKTMTFTLAEKEEFDVVLEPTVDWISPLGTDVYWNLDATSSSNRFKYLKI